MSKSTYPLKLLVLVKEAARRLAESEGVSLKKFITAAVAEKVGALDVANYFLKCKARDSTPKDLLLFIENAPDVQPLPDDKRLSNL